MARNGAKYRQACIDACPEDIRLLIQQAIDRAFETGRYVEGPREPYYAARDKALALIGKVILDSQARAEQLRSET